ncbi:DUF3761 domain-containing protein [Mycobacterium mantenii]|uniref:DUF3761 domain-containing protein n=1 Tax=Mycobacterium mantenii TaxID=560555 RepID=UPI0038CC05DD
MRARRRKGALGGFPRRRWPSALSFLLSIAREGAGPVRSIIAVAIIAVGYGTIAVAAPPIAAANECPPGFYWSKAHSTCVERPDNNPVGAVALCGDGNYSHSESRSGTCSDNDGIRQWCPCGGAPSLASAPAAGAAPDDDDYVSLAVSLVTGLPAGWGTAGSQDKANQIAVDQ